MKKLILSAALISVLGGAGFAQQSQDQPSRPSSDSRERLQLGIKAGINYSNVYDEETNGFQADPKLGFVAGGFLSIPFGRLLGLQPEILYSQKGFEAFGTIGGDSYHYVRTTGYVDIPLQVQLKPAEHVTLVAGPLFSFLINRRETFRMGNISEEEEDEIENVNIRRNTLGATGGIEVNVMPVVLSAKVGWDLQHNNGDGTSTFPRYKNVWVQGTVGFKFF